MKTCHRCNTLKPFTDFNRHARSKDGFQSECRECQSKRAKSYRDDPASRPNILQRKKIRYYANHEKEKQNRNDLKARKRAVDAPSYKLGLMLEAARGRSKKNHWPMDVGRADFDVYEGMTCEVFGLMIDWNNPHGNADTSPTLDRILGGYYTKGNVRIISMLANIAKKDLTRMEIIALIEDTLKTLELLPEDEIGANEILQLLRSLDQTTI